MQLLGLGRICTTTTSFWQKGDDYMGDPGQEEQGLNSVYDTDTTVKLVADIVNEINQITQMK